MSKDTNKRPLFDAAIMRQAGIECLKKLAPARQAWDALKS